MLWSDVDFETASHCKNITEPVKLVDPCVWPNGLERDGLSGGRGERKQEAEVNCWESEISTLNSAWQ